MPAFVVSTTTCTALHCVRALTVFSDVDDPNSERKEQDERRLTEIEHLVINAYRDRTQRRVPGFKVPRAPAPTSRIGIEPSHSS